MNKKFIGSLFFLFLVVTTVFAQDPVQWNYSTKKTGDKTYEIHLTATIEDSWHIYGQDQPEDAVSTPTTIKFNNNPLLTFTGKIKEIGKMEKHVYETLGVTQNQYSHKVDFVQMVMIKANAKTNVSGNIEFQACTDEMCLPAKTIVFTIVVKG